MAEFDFIVDRHCRPYSRMYLPDSFAMAMANRRPEGFWLQVEGCPNGPSWVVAEYAPDDAILLSKGWKAFARSLVQRTVLGLQVQWRSDLAGEDLPRLRWPNQVLR